MRAKRPKIIDLDLLSDSFLKCHSPKSPGNKEEELDGIEEMCNSSTLKSIDPKRHARLNHKLQSKYPSFRMQVQDSKVAKLKLS